MRFHDAEALPRLLEGQGRRLEVFCDGIRQHRVASADEEAGTVARWVDAMDGRPEAGQRLEVITGRVQIEIVRAGQ